MHTRYKEQSLTTRFRRGLVALVFLGAYTVSAVAPVMNTTAAYASPDASYSNNQNEHEQENKNKNEHENKNENKNAHDAQNSNNNQNEHEEHTCNDNRTSNAGEYKKHGNDSRGCPEPEDEEHECNESPSVSANSRQKSQGHSNGCPQPEDDECNDNRRNTHSYGNEGHCGPQQPPMPTQYDPCGTANDTYTIPQVPGVTYKVNNQVVSAGVHYTGGALTVTVTIHAQQGSGYTKDNSTTLTFTNVDCYSPVLEQKPGQLCVPGADNDIISYPIIAHVTYTQTGWANGQNTVTATADAGYYFQGTEGLTQVQWVLIDENTECGGGGGESMPVTPAEPSVVAVCGPNNDTVTLPVTDHVTYTQTGWANGQNTVTATADPGYYIQGTENETTVEWTFTDANTPCGEVLGETTTTPNVPVVPVGGQGAALQDTGNDMVLPMLLSTGILGLAVMTMLQSNASRRRPSRLAVFLGRATDQLQLAFAQPFSAAL